jgi:hypothetical protein
MRRLLAGVLVACTPAATAEPAGASRTTTAATASAAAPGPAAVDARVEFEEGPDPAYGEGASSVRAFLVVRALGIRRRLFAVPFPYRCGRGESDASADLVVQCTGDDGTAYAVVRVEAGALVVVARDYGQLDLQRAREEIPLPRGGVATVFAPASYPDRRGR